MKKLKYQEQISILELDFNEYNEQDRQSFRWVFKNINDPRNFAPKYVIYDSEEKIDARGWAISFFESKDKSRLRLLKLTKDKEHLFKKLGTHIAEGVINIPDGLSNISDKNGHFTHFEYENVDLESKHVIIEQVAN